VPKGEGRGRAGNVGAAVALCGEAGALRCRRTAARATVGGRRRCRARPPGRHRRGMSAHKAAAMRFDGTGCCWRRLRRAGGCRARICGPRHSFCARFHHCSQRARTAGRAAARQARAGEPSWGAAKGEGGRSSYRTWRRRRRLRRSEELHAARGQGLRCGRRAGVCRAVRDKARLKGGETESSSLLRTHSAHTQPCVLRAGREMGAPGAAPAATPPTPMPQAHCGRGRHMLCRGSGEHMFPCRHALRRCGGARCDPLQRISRLAPHTCSGPTRSTADAVRRCSESLIFSTTSRAAKVACQGAARRQGSSAEVRGNNKKNRAGLRA
jgi:hypothetical protein